MQVITELQESNEQFVSAWAMFARAFPKAEVAVDDRLAIGWPDVPLIFYNNIFILGEMSSRNDLAAEVDKAIERSKRKKHLGMMQYSLRNRSLSRDKREQLAAVRTRLAKRESSLAQLRAQLKAFEDRYFH